MSDCNRQMQSEIAAEYEAARRQYIRALKARIDLQFLNQQLAARAAEITRLLRQPTGSIPDYADRTKSLL